jgi:hypothetical protein
MDKKVMLVATVKVVVAVPADLANPHARAADLIGGALDTLAREPSWILARLVDWGFAPTPDGGRAFPRQVVLPEGFVELRDQVKKDADAPPADLEVGELEEVERLKEYEREFDRL